MSHSKYGVTAAWLILMSQSVHAAQEMPSFDRMRQLYRDSNDPSRISYVYRRCAALQLNVSALLVRKKQSKAAADYENLAKHYMLLSEKLDVEVDAKRGVKPTKTMETINLSVKHLSEEYDQRLKANHKKRGEYFAGDPVLEAELAECLKPDDLAKSFEK